MANIVLVHGLWTDWSVWGDVMPILREAGHWVHAVQLPLTSLHDDIGATRCALDMWPAPVVLAGWSYGGAVITNAARRAPNVTGLVYLAAFAPDEGESVSDINRRFPPTALASAIRPTQRGEAIRIDQEHYPQVFGADIQRWRAAELAGTQKPVSPRCLYTPSGRPAWRRKRCWYQISEHDQALSAQAQRWMAERTGATTMALPTSHASPLSRPREVADLIIAAAADAPTPVL
ncbi:alpha/beta hydrolase [Streptomyces sp. NPDC029004]|uniref:alpha/beta hydrolase n=1 Tax=Streptomyces sp. NPDC029004 TaxID=3154490 RepID=UPI0033DEFB80